MSVIFKKCDSLNDRVVKGEAINAECEGTKEQCPKIRSMKRCVNPQCWKIKAKKP